MKIKEFFKSLSKFEIGLWATSLIVITLSFVFSPNKDYLTLVASLIGVTSLIFVAKGYVLGQFLCVIFGLLYGVISYFSAYYGEMITYVGMSAPMALVAAISWLKHPYKKTAEVEVKKLSKMNIIVMVILSIAVTVAFYFLLSFLGTANLIVSTISVTTSFAAVFLLYLRSPYYAIAYAANDIVLVVLWVLASITEISNLPMIFCFLMFLFNDLYGFFNWKRMQNRQNSEN